MLSYIFEQKTLLILFFLQASWIVKLDILILLFGSIAAWAIIFDRCYLYIQFSKSRPSPQTNQSLEKGLLFLATIGSVAPYVGLFGTVCGIISALLALSSHTANISILMPGIGEALITTALGLVTAIPAIIAYNHLLAWKERLMNEEE